MEQPSDNALGRFDRPTINYPMLIVEVVVFAVLIAGIAVSIRSQDWAATGLFFAAAAGLVIIALLFVAFDRSRAAATDRKFIKWDAALPELQRQNVNLEVRELARQLNVGGNQLTDLLSAYIVAEDLALRQIQQEEKLPLMRHVQIGKTSFDAILIDRDLITCIEVSFLVTPDVRQDKIESILKKISQAKKNLADMKLRLRLKLMLVLVTQLGAEDEEHLRGTLITRRFSETPVDIDIRMLDFEGLQKIYVTD